ncbi:site-specific integrase [Pseudovibrio ascidiaceicola]|uniref:site-specific integrase n=1 Tax=Pseudovibrio ascidiaceicola TaxID=285279 RepID=UPI003D36E7EF
MPKIQHVYRRGAVYYWQRRLPKKRIQASQYEIPCKNNCIERDEYARSSGEYQNTQPEKIQLCLHARELCLAKQRASLLTAFSEIVFREYRQGMLSGSQVVVMVQDFGVAFMRDLDAAALLAKQRADFNIDSEESKERIMHWVHKLFAAHGSKIELRDRDRALMAKNGLGLREIAAVEQSLCNCEFRADKFVDPTKIKAVLTKHNIEHNASNFFEARQAYFRAGAQVLKDSGRRWQGEFAEDAQILSQAITAEVQPYGYQIRSMPSVGIQSDIEVPAERAAGLNSNHKSSVQTQKVPTKEIAEKLIQDKRRDKTWGEPSEKQCRTAAKLFVWATGVEFIGELTESDLRSFRDIMLNLPKSFGKSPKDYDQSLEEVLEKASRMSLDEVAFSPSTINKHFQKLDDMIVFFNSGADHQKLHWFNGTAAYRTKRQGRAKEDRNPFESDTITKIFDYPFFIGCKSDARRHIAGDIVVHDSQFWVPIIAAHSGMRRSEITGLNLSDVRCSEGIHYFNIEENEHRGLKNKQSKRLVPIHQAILKLGFLDYIKELKARGFSNLFPELHLIYKDSGTGEAFSKSGWNAAIPKIIPDHTEKKLCFHSFRHSVITALHRLKVDPSVCKNIAGHLGEDVHEERYLETAELQVLAEAISKLPSYVGDLPKRPIRLSHKLSKKQRKRKTSKKQDA